MMLVQRRRTLTVVAGPLLLEENTLLLMDMSPLTGCAHGAGAEERKCSCRWTAARARC